MAVVRKSFEQKVETRVLADAAQSFVGRGQATEPGEGISQFLNLGVLSMGLNAVQQRLAVAAVQSGVGEEGDVLLLWWVVVGGGRMGVVVVLLLVLVRSCGVDGPMIGYVLVVLWLWRRRRFLLVHWPGLPAPLDGIGLSIDRLHWLGFTAA